MRETIWLWHRRLGLMAALFLLVFAATGVLLNHGRNLGLHEARVNHPWLMRHYGLVPEAPLQSWRVSTGWVFWLDGRLFLGTRRVAEDIARPRGAVATNHVVAVATPTALWLFTSEGQLVERIASETLPGEILRIGRGPDGEPIIATAAGRYAGDGALVRWRRVDVAADWSTTETASVKMREEILRRFRGEGIALDRVLLDLHTGRLFGTLGPYLFDAAAVALFVLVISGIVNAIGTGRPGRRPWNTQR